MKYIKSIENFNPDIFGEDNWEEVDQDGSFLTWLKFNYPDESKWKDIKRINCTRQNLTNLNGIENLRNLIYLDWSFNQLTNKLF